MTRGGWSGFSHTELWLLVNAKARLERPGKSAYRAVAGIRGLKRRITAPASAYQSWGCYMPETGQVGQGRRGQGRRAGIAPYACATCDSIVPARTLSKHELQ